MALGGDHKSANAWQAEAMAADMDLWLQFIPGKTVMPFEEWLDNNLPSQTYRSSGIGWIAVRAPAYGKNLLVENTQTDVVGLQHTWEALQQSGRPINRKVVTEMAKAYGVTCGKWFFYAETGLKVDHLWEIVARGVVQGKLGHTAKVSPSNDVDQSDSNHVICIYNNDFTDEEEVLSLEDKIRKLGLKGRLMYKPDAYTYLGIYRSNEWGLRPTIYKSDYDINAGAIIEVTNDNFQL